MLLRTRTGSPECMKEKIVKERYKDILAWIQSVQGGTSPKTQISPPIRRNDFYESLLSQLFEYFAHKCMFCESEIDIDQAKLFYYRPYFHRIEALSANYIWLCWHWHNMYLICANCDKYYKKNRKDKIVAIGKDEYFPLLDSRKRVNVLGNYSNKQLFDIQFLNDEEKPKLFDPCYDNPEMHFKYVARGQDEIIPVAVDSNIRAQYTIDLFKLDNEELGRARKSALIFFHEEFLKIIKSSAEVDVKLFQALCHSDQAFAGMKRYFLQQWLDENDAETRGEAWQAVRKQLQTWREETAIPSKPFPPISIKSDNGPILLDDLTMPTIDWDIKVDGLNDEIISLIKQLCSSYKRIVVSQQFRVGFSGAHVFLLHRIPYKNQTLDDYPLIVKIDLLEKVKVEAENYQKHGINSLQKCVKLENKDAPLLISPSKKYASIAYNFAGGEAYNVKSLFRHWQQHKNSKKKSLAPLETLFDAWQKKWSGSDTEPESLITMFSYDWILPPCLTIYFNDYESTECPTINEKNYRNFFSADNGKAYEAGAKICLDSFFIVNDINYEKNELTLDLPENYHPHGFCIRIQKVTNIDHFHLGKKLPYNIFGTVHTNRILFLKQKVQQHFSISINDIEQEKIIFQGLLNNYYLSNPLYDLNEIMKSKIISPLFSVVHGDMNLENILVRENTGGSDIYVIDFGKTRSAHNIHDLLRLEAGIWLYLVSAKRLNSNESNYLDKLTILFDTVDQDQGKTISFKNLQIPYKLLSKIRQEAHIIMKGNIEQKKKAYYIGLCLYMLGALKYGNLEISTNRTPKPKQIAFQVACLAYHHFKNGKLPEISPILPPLDHIDSKRTAERVDDKQRDSENRVFENNLSVRIQQEKNMASNPSHLYEQIAISFNISELKALCHEIGVDYENISGENKLDKSREIVAYCKRHQKLLSLIEKCGEKRPKITWDAFEALLND